MEFDNNMMNNEQMRDEVAGTTAVTVLIKGDQLYCVSTFGSFHWIVKIFDC